MPIGDIYETRFNYTLYGQRLMNVLHYKQLIADPAGTNPANLVIDGLQVAGGMQAVIRQAIPSDCSLDSIDAQLIYPTRKRYIRRVVGLPGQWESAATTANVAASIEKYTALAGRNQVGRIQIPISPLADACVGGFTTPDMRAALQDIAAQIPFVLHAADSVLAQFGPVLFHRQNPQTPNIPPSYNDIAGAFAMDTVRVMTRRTVGRGI